MSITLNTKAYVLDTFKSVSEALYSGPAATFAFIDSLLLGRGKTAAREGVHNGYFRGTLKMERSFTSTIDSVKRAGNVTVTWSIPSDASTTDVDSLRDDVGDLLISSNGQDLFNKQDINQ